jgi:Spy/CpxP family protein refolding chaperone
MKIWAKKSTVNDGILYKRKKLNKSHRRELMKKRLIATLTVLALVIAMSTLSFARGRRGGPGRHFHPRFGVRMLVKALSNPEVLKKTGISASKAASIKKIIYAARKASITIFAKIKVEHLNLREEFDADAISQTKVLAIMKRIHDLRWQLAKIMVSTKVRTSNMLTKGQKVLLKKIIRERFRRYVGRRYGRGGHRMHRGSGGSGMQGPGGPGEPGMGRPGGW